MIHDDARFRTESVFYVAETVTKEAFGKANNRI